MVNIAVCNLEQALFTKRNGHWSSLVSAFFFPIDTPSGKLNHNQKTARSACNKKRRK